MQCIKAFFSRVIFFLVPFLCSVVWGTVPALAQDFTRQQISTTIYTTPLLQQRYSSFQFNPPILFDVGGTAGTQNIFQVVPLTTANTATFNVAAPGQATTYKFTDPGGANATFAFLEGTQTLSGTKTFSAAVTITPTASLTLGTAGTAVGQAIFLNATSGSVTVAPTTGALGTPTLTLGTNAGGVPVVLACGSTGTGNQTCAPAAANGKTQVYSGQSTLSTNAAVITFPNTFTSTTSFMCVANDVTTRANPVQMVPASATTATITNTTGGSDVVQWICAGN